MNISIFLFVHFLLYLIMGGQLAFQLKRKLVTIFLHLLPLQVKKNKNQKCSNKKFIAILTLVIVLLGNEYLNLNEIPADQTIQHEISHEGTPTISSVPIYVPKPTQFFVQIGAFKNQRKAIQLKNQVGQNYLTQCRVGIHAEDSIPFKVVFGPFANKVQAQFFLEKQNLYGYLKPVEQIDFFLPQ